MHLKKMVAIAFAAVLVFTAVGCSSSKKSDTVSASGDSSTTTTASSNSDSDSGSNSGSGSGSATSANCIEASTAYASLFLASAGFASGATQEELDQFEKNANDLKAKIPDEVKDDFETVANAYRDYIEQLKGLDMTDAFNADTMAKLQAAAEKISTPEVEAAQDRIDKYFTDNCGS
jgi:hypothetical protein